MPWNEPGKGDKDGWRSGSDQPPDLDEVFRRISARMRGLFGGGGGRRDGGSDGGFPLFGLFGVLAILWLAFDSAHILDQADRGVVLRFGEHVRTLQPGLNFTWPRPVESLTKVNISEVRSVQDRARMLTGDENLIDIGFEVQYRVENPEHFLFNVRAPEAVLAQSAESAMREVVGSSEMDFILEKGRGEVASSAGELMQRILNDYETGLVVTQFNLPDVKPPSQVKPAFDDVINAREDQQRFVNEAQAYTNKVVPEARGNAARVLEEAEAYRQSQIALAEGEADRFSLLLEEYAKAPEVTRQRLYLETLEAVLARSNKVYLDTGDGNNVLYLPLDKMNERARRLPPSVAAPERESGINSGPGDTSRNRGRSNRESQR